MPYEHNGKQYRSYKHPILEYIFDKALEKTASLPDEILFTYEDIRQAMDAIGMKRHKQASLSNFTIDLTRHSASSRVPESILSRGYDLDRASERQVRQNIAGRLVRSELKAAEPWIVWHEIDETNTYEIENQVPEGIRRFLGNDEGALLSVMDYCDVLSYVLNQQPHTVFRVQHPKKWQPGEVDGLYFSAYQGNAILYPVEAKALSTGDSVNLAQIQGAYRTIVAKMTDVQIIPLAIQMTAEGMYIAIFEPRNNAKLVIVRSLKVHLLPPIAAWQKKSRKKNL